MWDCSQQEAQDYSGLWVLSMPESEALESSVVFPIYLTDQVQCATCRTARILHFLSKTHVNTIDECSIWVRILAIASFNRVERQKRGRKQFARSSSYSLVDSSSQANSQANYAPLTRYDIPQDSSSPLIQHIEYISSPITTLLSSFTANISISLILLLPSHESYKYRLLLLCISVLAKMLILSLFGPRDIWRGVTQD